MGVIYSLPVKFYEGSGELLSTPFLIAGGMILLAIVLSIKYTDDIRRYHFRCLKSSTTPLAANSEMKDLIAQVNKLTEEIGALRDLDLQAKEKMITVIQNLSNNLYGTREESVAGSYDGDSRIGRDERKSLVAAETKGFNQIRLRPQSKSFIARKNFEDSSEWSGEDGGSCGWANEDDEYQRSKLGAFFTVWQIGVSIEERLALL
jgi:hypothetical protein